jgi:hypothetical protein
MMLRLREGKTMRLSLQINSYAYILYSVDKFKIVWHLMRLRVQLEKCCVSGSAILALHTCFEVARSSVSDPDDF